MRFTKKAQKLLKELEELHPGEIFVEMLSRDEARLRVRGTVWEFVIEDGILALKPHKVRVEKTLFQLAFFKASEGIFAVRMWHKEATDRARAKKVIRAKDLRKGQLDLFGPKE